ncbi:MAG: sugar phosphorylase [Anaerolineaceae bacterium]
MIKNQQILYDLLIYLYGTPIGENVFRRLKERLLDFQKSVNLKVNPDREAFNQEDVVLITYGDLLQRNGEAPLNTLFHFFTKYLKEFVNTIHILPFFPFSSDDGFSVIDYLKVDPNLGTWEDIRNFKKEDIRLMFDGVINHISAESNWFQQFLKNDPKYTQYFITTEPDTDLSLVTRPRTLPLLTPFQTPSGKKWVWTTFSDDQIDLNFKNPDVLLDIIDVLLCYIQYGANLIRLDAIAYLWKEIGTSCIHLHQTHAVVQLLRAILDDVAQGVLIISETNVPHEENISYFGNGNNEAHLVYQFALPPLVAHALLTGSAIYLTKWASELKPPSPSTSFFNFTASHDGIGLRPVSGILPPREMEVLLRNTLEHGGKISSKTNSDGSASPYELNITYYDLLNNPVSNEPEILQVKKFLVSQAIQLALAGIPGIYLHNLLGSRNYTIGVEETGLPRTINRQKLEINLVESELADKTSIRNQVFYGYSNLIKCRVSENSFHPNGNQQILELSTSVFSVLRTSPSGSQKILALHNLTSIQQNLEFDINIFGNQKPKALEDILSKKVYSIHKLMTILLEPYEIVWLRIK